MEKVRFGLKESQLGWAKDLSRSSDIRGRENEVRFVSDTTHSVSAAERFRLKEVEAGLERIRSRMEKVRARWQEARFQSATVRSRSTTFRLVSDEVQSHSVAFRFGSPQDRAGPKKVRVRRKEVRSQSRKVRSHSITVRLLSVACRRRLSNACSCFETARFSHKYEVILMDNTANETTRSVAVLALPRRIDAFIAYAVDVVRAMTVNPAFPSPAPALATVLAAVEDLRVAEAQVMARHPGATVGRDARRAVLVTLLQSLRMHVQSVADANAERGPAIIRSASMAVQKTAERRPRVFAALAGPVAGTVKLVAPSGGDRASYNWQYSTDGEAWIDLPSTLQAKTTLSGQTPGAVAQFRYRAVTKTGETPWSAPVLGSAR